MQSSCGSGARARFLRASSDRVKVGSFGFGGCRGKEPRRLNPAVKGQSGERVCLRRQGIGNFVALTASSSSSAGTTAVTNILSMIIVPRAFLRVREALVCGLDSSEPLGGAFDVMRVLVRMFLECDFAEPVAIFASSRIPATASETGPEQQKQPRASRQS